MAMCRSILLVCMIAAFANGCANSRTTRADASNSSQTTAASGCIPTQPIHAPSPEGTNGEPFGPELYFWYTNADRSIWMLRQDWTPGERVKTAWFRPAGAQLDVSGRRLDGAAPALLIEIGPASAYPHRFMPSIMTFPTGGCWEIVAKTDRSEARFVVRVPMEGSK
jgi:hypothetical protein